MDDPRSAEPGRRGASFKHRSVATLLSRRGCRDAAGCCASGCAPDLGLAGQSLREIGALTGALQLRTDVVSSSLATRLARDTPADTRPPTLEWAVVTHSYW